MTRIKKPMEEKISIRLDRRLLTELARKARALNIDRTEAVRRAVLVWTQQIDLEEKR